MADRMEARVEEALQTLADIAEIGGYMKRETKEQMLKAASALKNYFKLFHTKVLPIAPYGFQLIWEHLITSCLRKLEKVKATYLKKSIWSIKAHPITHRV